MTRGAILYTAGLFASGAGCLHVVYTAGLFASDAGCLHVVYTAGLFASGAGCLHVVYTAGLFGSDAGLAERGDIAPSLTTALCGTQQQCLSGNVASR